jgi:signal transduction histidine kinase
MDLRYVRVNRTLAEMNGIPADAHEGHTDKELFPATGTAVMDLLARVRDTGETITNELRVEGDARSAPRHWRVKYYPVTIRAHCVGVGAICDEITKQKHSELQLELAHEGERIARTEAERLNRMKDEFLSTVSHELRTPLQSILGWARTLREGGLEPAQVEHGLMIIERNAHGQARIIEDLLDVSRIISGQLRIARHPVELAQAVEFAMDTIRPAALAKSISLTSTIEPALGPIMADDDRIKQVLWNLLSNAVKFTPEGGTVSVSVERAQTVVEIRVTDSGQGVRQGFLPYVFERFRQQDGGTTRAQGGLGLGLAIVRHIVEMHGGTVGVDSEGEGRGATFIVRLPAQAPPRSDEPRAPRKEVRAPEERKTPVKPLDGIRILVVDDEEDARELLALVLRRNGAHTDSAGSVREALERLQGDLYDVVVSDIGMPDQDGYALGRAMKSHPRRPRVLLALTAYARAEDRRAALPSSWTVAPATSPRWATRGRICFEAGAWSRSPGTRATCSS